MQCIASQDIKENEKLSLVFLDTEFPVGGGVLGMENPGGGGQTRKDPPGVGGGGKAQIFLEPHNHRFAFLAANHLTSFKIFQPAKADYM